MPPAPTQRAGVDDARLLAPPWHTAALVSLMLAVAAMGTWLSSRPSTHLSPPAASPVAAYLAMIVVQWALALYVCRIGRGRNALPQLLGRPWSSARRAGVDLALAAGVWMLIEASEAYWTRQGMERTAATIALLPHTAGQHAVWFAVAASAGFCEEVVYRGYLQAQLTSFTGAAAVGIALQAILFGIAHGDQGLAVATRFALYGCAFGALARWRRSLWPGIACHAGIDVASGLVGR